MPESGEAISGNSDFELWFDEAISLDKTKAEIHRLMQLQHQADQQTQHLTQLFMSRFSSALLQLRPNFYALIRPSSRRNVTSARMVDSGTILFRDNNGIGVELTEFTDYLVCDFSSSTSWNAETLQEHKNWLIGAMKELDAQDSSAS